MAYKVIQHTENYVEYQMQNTEGQIRFPFSKIQLAIQKFLKT